MEDEYGVMDDSGLTYIADSFQLETGHATAPQAPLASTLALALPTEVTFLLSLYEMVWHCSVACSAKHAV